MTVSLIVYDDANIPFGSLKLKRSGSGGGHNGVQNIIDRLKSKNFGQLRIGIGKPYPVR
jgi:PTH1 family peptidyl-tRNA hydrolase